MSARPTWLDETSITDLTDRTLIGEVEHLLHGHTHPVDIAARLGASLSGMENRLQNAGRPDLAAAFTTARSGERAAGALT